MRAGWSAMLTSASLYWKYLRLTDQCRVCWICRPRLAQVWVTANRGLGIPSCMRGKQSGSRAMPMEEPCRTFDTTPSATALESEPVSETDVLHLDPKLNLTHCVRVTDVAPLAGLANPTTLYLSRCENINDVTPLAGWPTSAGEWGRGMGGRRARKGRGGGGRKCGGEHRSEAGKEGGGVMRGETGDRKGRRRRRRRQRWWG